MLGFGISIADSMVKASVAQSRTIKRGWFVRGLFEDRKVLHGLVFNPNIANWFQLSWDLNTGKCLTFNTNELYDLYLDA